MRKIMVAVGLILASTAITAGATPPQQPSVQNVQSAPAPLKGGVCRWIPNRLVECDYLGKLASIKQIYEQGWRVVTTVVNQNDRMDVITILIEEQR